MLLALLLSLTSPRSFHEPRCVPWIVYTTESLSDPLVCDPRVDELEISGHEVWTALPA